jgi:hypothetical protein
MTAARAACATFLPLQGHVVPASNAAGIAWFGEKPAPPGGVFASSRLSNEGATGPPAVAWYD